MPVLDPFCRQPALRRRPSVLVARQLHIGNPFVNCLQSAFICPDFAMVFLIAGVHDGLVWQRRQLHREEQVRLHQRLEGRKL